MQAPPVPPILSHGPQRTCTAVSPNKHRCPHYQAVSWMPCSRRREGFTPAGWTIWERMRSHVLVQAVTACCPVHSTSRHPLGRILRLSSRASPRQTETTKDDHPSRTSRKVRRRKDRKIVSDFSIASPSAESCRVAAFVSSFCLRTQRHGIDMDFNDTIVGWEGARLGSSAVYGSFVWISAGGS